MSVSYKRLFHLLIDKNMTAAELQKEAGYSANISTRLRNDTYISLESVEKICPVSYTHLDVYKRQLQHRPLCRLPNRLPWANS